MSSGTKIANYLVSGSVWSIGGQLVSVVGGILQMSLLSRLLTASEMGAYLLVYSIILLAGIVGMYGIPETMMREVARLLKGEGTLEGASKSLVRRTYFLVILITIALSILFAGWFGEILFYRIFSIERSGSLLLYFGVWLAFHCLHYTTIFVYRGQHDVVKATLYGVPIRTFLSVVVLAVLYASGRSVSLEEVILVNAFVTGLSLVLSLIPLRDLWINRSTSISEVISFKELLTQSTPLCLNASLQEVYLRSGMWALGYFVVKDLSLIHI